MTKIIYNVEVVPQEATEPGALGGWDVYCSKCGHTGGAFLKGTAANQALEHRAWHEAQDAERALEMQQAVASEVKNMLWRITNASIEGRDDEGQDDIGQLGNVLNQMLYPDNPEAQATLPAVKAGVEMFLDGLMGEQPSGLGITE